LPILCARVCSERCATVLLLACKAVTSEGTGGARPSIFQICDPDFMFGLPGCCIHSIMYFYKSAPPCDFWPPCCEILATGLLACELRFYDRTVAKLSLQQRTF